MFRPRFIVLLCLLGPSLLMFGLVLVGWRGLVFRDGAHYYYPLFQWTARQWGMGEIPLWNPRENGGQPLLADPTASVLYPGKLLFALPLPYAVCYAWYVWLHLLMSAWWAYFIARRWNNSVVASGLGGLSYALGGYVLVQTCNVVYLVGAAWLPAVLWSADLMMRQRRARWAIALGLFMALMVLGGDAQLAYHSVLLVLVYAMILWRQGGGGRRWALLATSIIIAMILAAVQILPSVQWSSASQRNSYVHPRSIYEALGGLNDHDFPGSVTQGLFGSPRPGHAQDIYAFSLAPWHLPEFIWPNFSGRLFPVNRRWITAIPGEGRTWTPSLYMGAITILLAMSGWTLRGADVRRRWLSWSLLLSVLGSFGWYGLGWLVEEIGYSVLGRRGPPLIGAPVGGLYWVMVVLLPGYALFRYPAKLLVISSLCISLLAAGSWDRVFTQCPRGVSRSCWILASASGGAAVLLWATRPLWVPLLRQAPNDPLFGPLDAAGASLGLVASGLHAMVVFGLLAILFSRWARINLWQPGTLALVLTACELTAANYWLAPTAPQDYWRRPSWAKQRIARSQDQPVAEGASVPIRIYRGNAIGWMPSKWATSSSWTRQWEGLAWDRDTLFPKYQLLDSTDADAELLNVDGAMVSARWSALMTLGREQGAARPDGVRELRAPLLQSLSVQFVLLPSEMIVSSARRIADSSDDPADVALWRMNAPMPQAWIVQHLEVVAETGVPGSAALAREMEQIWIPGGQWRDLRQQAVVQGHGADQLADQLQSDLPALQSSARATHCRITSLRAGTVDVHVQLSSPGFLVLNQAFDPGWGADVRSDGQLQPWRGRVWRTNGVMRGLMLPAGDHQVRMSYQPGSVWIGAAISVTGWALLAVWLVISGWGRRLPLVRSDLLRSRRRTTCT